MNRNSTSLSDDEILAHLDFSARWFDAGIVDEHFLSRVIAEFRQDEEPSPEHYRYGAFVDYLRGRAELSNEQCRALFEIGANDPDPSMGASIMLAILNRRECPLELFDQAASHERTAKSFLEARHRHHFDSDVNGYRQPLLELGPEGYLIQYNTDHRGRPRTKSRLYHEMSTLFGLDAGVVNKLRRQLRADHKIG